jgi:hypothetical protein
MPPRGPWRRTSAQTAPQLQNVPGPSRNRGPNGTRPDCPSPSQHPELWPPMLHARLVDSPGPERPPQAGRGLSRLRSVHGPPARPPTPSRRHLLIAARLMGCDCHESLSLIGLGAHASHGRHTDRQPRRSLHDNPTPEAEAVRQLAGAAGVREMRPCHPVATRTRGTRTDAAFGCSRRAVAADRSTKIRSS